MLKDEKAAKGIVVEHGLELELGRDRLERGDGRRPPVHSVTPEAADGHAGDEERHREALGVSATSSVPGPLRAAPRIVVLPTPSHFCSRGERAAPASQPVLPSANTIPISPADMPSVRAANTRTIENATFEKKFEVPVEMACGRR